ncbi:MAG: hypothetical protein ACJ8CN_00810 [Gemmatimonadales bacterium]
MAITDVYLTTDNLPTPIELRLQRQSNDPGATLLATSVEPRSSATKVLSVPRNLSRFDAYHLDLSLRLRGGPFIAALQILLRGHGDIGSMIWWRWRTATEQIGRWETDDQPYLAEIRSGALQFDLTIQGVSLPARYDDINLCLRRP